MTFLIALADRFVPAEFARDSDDFRRARLLVAMVLSTVGYGPVFALSYWLLGAPLLALGILVTVGLAIFSPLLLRATRSIPIAGNYSIATLAAVLVLCAVHTGGVGSAGHYWSVALPVFGSLLARRRSGIAWSLFVAVETAALYALERAGRMPTSFLSAQRVAILHVLSIATLSLLMFSLGWIYESIKDRMRATLAAANSELRLILDNTGQGFLTIARDGSVAGERSAIIDEWLGPPPPGATLASLVSAVDAHAGFALELCWMQIAEELLPLEVAMMQLPSRLRRGEQSLELAYRPIVRQGRLARMLVVISDISAEVARERAERAEAELLALVKRLMSDRAGSRDFFEESREQCARLLDPATDERAVMRDVHTLKGNCGLFGLAAFAEACHALEEAVAARGQPATLEERRQLVEGWQRTAGAVAMLLEEAPRDVEVSRAEHAELLGLLQRDAPKRQLLQLAASWAHEPASRRLARLGEGAVALASRLGKPPVAIAIEDHGVRVPRSGWQELWSALVHLIRNAVDHGIEHPEERTALGKPPHGSLTLRTLADDDSIVIEVTDDGAGVAWERVRARARQLGLPSATQLELEAALFCDGLSTRETASEISGRGVGMAVVRVTCSALGGTISIRSEPGRGTTFRIAIPHRGPPRETAPPRRAASPTEPAARSTAARETSPPRVG